MSNLQYQEYYRRHLPHFQPRGFGFFITFRLVNSLPRDVIEKLLDETGKPDVSPLKSVISSEQYNLKTIEQLKHFEQWDAALHSTRGGNRYLEDERVASIIADSIHFHDKEWFDLEAFCIMPNHVHLVLIPMEKTEDTDYSLAEIMHNIKRNSSKQANQILGRIELSGNTKITITSSVTLPNLNELFNMSCIIRSKLIWLRTGKIGNGLI